MITTDYTNLFLKILLSSIRSSVNHTLRRPSKRHVVAQSQDPYACCPRDEMNANQAHLTTTQSYATLRGRKWVDKQRRARCASGKNFFFISFLSTSSKTNTLQEKP